MENIKNKFYLKPQYMMVLVGFLSIIIGGYISSYNHYITSFILIISAVFLYFFIVYKVVERNWFDIRAVFSGIWLLTIGLASLRLLNYQENWQSKTWILLAISYLMFQIGATMGIMNAVKCCHLVDKIKNKINSNISFSLQENRLFIICIITTLIGLSCFIINVYIKGFIPAFSNDIFAYINFYTKFHIFAVASTACSSLCYYCIKTQNITRVKKVILWLCIFYLVILFPILVVSRGVFITAVIPLVTTVFYLNKRKLWVVIICFSFIGGTYLFMSELRNFSDDYLNRVFQPTEITVPSKPANDSQSNSNADKPNSSSKTDDNKSDISSSISIPPKMAFLYGYLTVSHDNFNEAVKNTVGYTWGARQFEPFNVILRIPAITETINNGEFYQVTPNLTTVNMIGIFYYDFHEVGIVLCTLLWAILFGLLQGIHMNKKGIISLSILGIIMNAVALSFFSGWVNSFDMWMYCGVVLIIGIIASIKIKVPSTQYENL